VFSDRQPGELVALFTRAIADLKAASGSPEIPNDSKKVKQSKGSHRGPQNRYGLCQVGLWNVTAVLRDPFLEFPANLSDPALENRWRQLVVAHRTARPGCSAI